MNHRRKSWSKAVSARTELKTKGLYLGTDVSTSRAVYLALQALATHMYLYGPTGVGKTRLLLWLFELLCQVKNATVILVNCKGELANMAFSWAVGAGLTKRLIHFPGKRGSIIGFNPLQANGLAPMQRVKAAREALLSGFGEGVANLHQTPQLARHIFYGLAAAEGGGHTIIEALDVIRPCSELRAALLPTIQNRHLFNALSHFDNLREQRQDEIGASTLARLEPFIIDSIVRHILTQQAHTLDLAEVIEEQKILLVDLPLYRSYRPEDVRMLGRLLINDLMGHVFNRPANKRGPVFLLIDECQNFMTQDLATALEMGRELGLHVILSNQFLHQFTAEDPSGRILNAVLSCARTKFIFGQGSLTDVEPVVRDAVLSQLDPYKVKDELTSLELHPREESREVTSQSWTTGWSVGKTRGSSSTESRTRTQSRSEMEAETDSDGYGRSKGMGQGNLAGAGTGQTMLPNGETAASHSAFASTNQVNMEGESEIHVHAKTHAQGLGLSVSEGESEGHNQSLNTAFTSSTGRSCSRVPFMTYEEQRAISSRQFLALEEQLHLWLQKTKAQPQKHFLLVPPTTAPRFLKAPWVPARRLSRERLLEAWDEVLSQPCYSTEEEIEAEEEARLERLGKREQGVWKEPPLSD